MLGTNINRIWRAILTGCAVCLTVVVTEWFCQRNRPVQEAKSRPPVTARLFTGVIDPAASVLPEAPLRISKNPDPLQVSLVLSKSEYMVGLPVECEYRVKNISRRDLYYGTLFPYLTETTLLEAPIGVEVRLYGGIINGGYVPKKLKPGESDRRTFLLNRLVWFTKPGTYTFRIRFQVDYGDDAYGKEWTSQLLEHLWSLKCRAEDPEEFRTQMQGLVGKALRGNKKEQADAVEAVTAIGLPETLPYLKECLAVGDAWLRNRLIDGLFEIGGPEAMAAIEEVIAKEKNADLRRHPEAVLSALRKKTDQRKSSP